MSVSTQSVPAGGRGSAKVSATIGGGWKMYSISQGAGGPIPTRISIGEGVFKLAGVSGPRPHVAMDPNFGINTESYTGGATFNVGFAVAANAPEGPQPLSVSVRYQVCNDTVCLPPKSVKLDAIVTVLPPKSSPTPSVSPSPTPTASTANTNANANLDVVLPPAVTSDANSLNALAQPEASPTPFIRTAGTSQDQSLWAFIWSAMLFGALSLLTPCVFPMVPITVSYFTKQEAGSHRRTVIDALIFTLGIVLTFTGLGILLAVLFGAAGLNRFAANPYINLLITAIFLAFAFSLLGAYNLGVPSSVLTKLDSLARSKETGKTIGLVLMGLTFSLTSFTCTAPFVGTVLVGAAQGQLLYPIVGMLAFSTVFALPFFVLAVAPRLMHTLPRAGSWMNSVKVVMGFLEVGAALKFLSNADLVWGWGIFTREVVLAGWVALAVMIFLYLLGVFRFFHDTVETHLGVVRVINAFLFGTLALYLLTGLFGARLGELESFLPPAKETSGVSTPNTAPNSELAWITNDYQAAIKQAQAENKRIFVDFTGYTCTNCRWMEANMFPKSAVRAELDKFVRVRLFTDGEGEPYEGFQRMQQDRFGTVALPLYAIISPQDEIVTTFEGLTRDPEQYLAFLKK